MELPFYIILYQPRKRPDCSEEQPRRFNLIKKNLLSQHFVFIRRLLRVHQPIKYCSHLHRTYHRSYLMNKQWLIYRVFLRCMTFLLVFIRRLLRVHQPIKYCSHLHRTYHRSYLMNKQWLIYRVFLRCMTFLLPM